MAVTTTTTTTGERRIVSVLVADVAGSTAIAEQLGAERSKFLFDEVIRLMTEQVQRYDGTVAQLTGDGLIALFGAPVAHEDDSERAVRAGLTIQRALVQYAHEVEAAYGVKLTARVGVNTGEVVYTPEVHDGEVRYNALGDAVNVAARLQQLADDGGVVVGPATHRQVESCFVLEALGEGRGAIVSIMGEPGIGKTRLVQEVRSRFRDRVRFIEGRAASYGHNFPFWPIRDLLREWLGVGATTPEARVRLELKAELSQLFGAEDADEAYPFFASILSVTLEPDPAQRPRELNRESIQNRAFELFYDWACKLSEEMPLCLVFEDLHAADEPTLELLESLLGVTEEAGVALFFLYRSEREHGSWRLGERARQRYPHRFKEIELRPLPSDAARQLIGNAANGEVPDTVAELLAERSGGNPFFLEEAFRDLVERGVLERRNGDWSLAVGVDELAVPALVQGALQARLDRLDPKTREVVNVAAVIGRTFGQAPLERLVPHDELTHALTELQRIDLIVEVRRRPHPEYRFRHGLVQEVAHASLVQSKRRKLHHRVGDALEEIFKESPEQAYGLLARNFEVADVPEKAVEYLLKAGDAARAIYADQEALEYYRKAREFLARTGDERRARDTLFKMALTYHVAFDFENAEDLYDEAFCCRVEEEPRLEPTERVETAEPRFGDLAPGDGGQHARLERRQGVPLPPARGRSLERRRAVEGRRLRVRVAEHGGAADDHLVHARGHRGGERSRRADPRGSAPRAAQLLPVSLERRLVVPLASAQVQGARRRLAQAREPRRQRSIRSRRVQRRARAHGREPALGRAAGEREGDPRLVLDRAGRNVRGRVDRRSLRRAADLARPAG